MRRIVLLALFATVLLGVLLGAHLYVHQRLVVDTALPPDAARAASVLLALLGASLVAQPIGERLLRPPRSRLVAWPASLWMGVAFLLLVGLGATDLVWGLGAAAARAAQTGLPGDGAAGAVHAARVRAALVLGATAVAGAVALRSGLAPPGLRRVEIRLPRWPRALDGLRIVQISDIHIGPILDRRFARALVERVNALAPDLVAVTGDLVDGRVDLLRDEVAPFAGLRGRLGVFFVTGNHDHYSGASAWAEQAAALGMTVLRNRHVFLEDRGSGFTLAGVDDHQSKRMPGEGGEDLDAALAGVRADAPVVLLAHDPSTFVRASRRGVDLQISGHTHGGQIWPFRHLVRIVIPFVEGLFRRGDAHLYVSRGTGFWGPPMRLGAPAEITELVLRAA